MESPGPRRPFPVRLPIPEHEGIRSDLQKRREREGRQIPDDMPFARRSIRRWIRCTSHVPGGIHALPL